MRSPGKPASLDQVISALPAGGDEALAITTRIAATWDSARLRGRLRLLGVRRRPSASKRARSGRLSLTDAEKAVATIAAQGSTNREIADKLFISPHTVNTRLRHVFEKLAVNSRVHLMRFVKAQLDDDS